MSTKPVTVPADAVRTITVERCENGWWVMIGSMETRYIRPVWVFNNQSDLAEFIRHAEWSSKP